MIPLYEDYLHENKSLTLDEMQKIHKSMVAEIKTDTDAMEIYNDFMGTAVRYAGIRAKWLMLTREDKMNQDSSRTSCHDALIVKLNMLARYLRMQGKDAAWRDALGDAGAEPSNRKRIGDFACYLAFISGICAR